MKKSRTNLLILFAIAFIRPFGISLYLTSFPGLCIEFNTTSGVLLQSLTFYLTGIGISGLYFGYLSDKFGRKKILISGLLCYALANFISVFSANISQFITFRIFQGLSFGFTLSVIYACYKDLYNNKNTLSKLISTSEILYGICAVISPFLGGFIYVYFSWQGNFVFISVISIILCILVMCYFNDVKSPEKLQCNNSCSYKSIITNKVFLLLTFMCLLTCTALFIQNVEIPFIDYSILGYTPMLSGCILFTLSFIFLFGNIINFYLLRFFKEEKIISFIASFYFFLGIAMYYSMLFTDNILFILLPLMLILFMSGIAFPICSSLALSVKEHNSGVTAGVIAFFIHAGNASITALLGLFRSDNTTLFFSLFALILITSFTWLFILIVKKQSYFKCE